MRRLVICALVWASLDAASAQETGRHFLWRVESPGAPPTYLLGSLHVLTPDHYPLSLSIEEAFRASTVLVQEVDAEVLNDPATLREIAGRAMLSDGRTLDQLIAPDLYQKLTARADAAGIPVEVLRRMKPWMASLMLTLPALQAAGFDAAHGVDRHFFERAKAAGYERRALETVAFQFERLDGMPLPTQEALLRSTLDDLDAQLADIRSIAEAWRRGDTVTLEKVLLATIRSSPDLYERLLVERNRAWVSAVERCLEQRTRCFVVVGAAHLVGPDSLVVLLKQKGYTVVQQ